MYLNLYNSLLLKLQNVYIIYKIYHFTQVRHLRSQEIILIETAVRLVVAVMILFSISIPSA